MTSILRDELSVDPLGRGYAGFSDQQAADDLNTVYRSRMVESIASELIVAALDPPDYTALSAANERAFWGIVGASFVRVSDTEVQAFFLALFPGGSGTRTNLIALANESISRAEELGLRTVKLGHVEGARS